ncbi:hypothetical protein [Calidithermus roseus]|uniref:Uncharacterized protein n=1 Tax=Calidithermus roseus TaxID=1644118 RepID=A0A399F2Y1_9DEIN|nr:hypothetical protein [Calidithermus roseus]RIH88971.1 hypothetical protein Mrose_00578 [Calidithermus roseus]
MDMVHKISLALLILAFFLFPWAEARISRGIVVYPTRLGCDYFIVSTPSGYALLQLWSLTVYKPKTGDEVVGEFETYGFREVINLTQEVTYRVWVEDYWLTASRAVERYLRKCPF